MLGAHAAMVNIEQQHSPLIYVTVACMRHVSTSVKTNTQTASGGEMMLALFISLLRLGCAFEGDGGGGGAGDDVGGCSVRMWMYLLSA